MLKGLRFRKIISLIPGVKLNLSKSGASVSLGQKGFTYNIGAKGSRTTVGAPGTGVSYSTYASHKETGSKNTTLFIWIGLLLIALVIVVFKNI
jgi:LPXTG-motif cell wall-anchored protein